MCKFICPWRDSNLGSCGVLLLPSALAHSAIHILRVMYFHCLFEYDERANTWRLHTFIRFRLKLQTKETFEYFTRKLFAAHKKSILFCIRSTLFCRKVPWAPIRLLNGTNKSKYCTCIRSNERIGGDAATISWNSSNELASEFNQTRW